MVALIGGIFLSMNIITTFYYDGGGITFATGDGIWINASEMSKGFGKRPADWLELHSTEEYLATLLEVRNCEEMSQFIKTAKGSDGGTWFHEDVAIEFARWLSPKFSIWCNDRVREYMCRTMSGNELLATLNKTIDKIVEQRSTIMELQRRASNKKKRSEPYSDAESWVDNNCRIGATLVPFQVIMSAYEMYCEANMVEKLSDATLGKILTARGYEKVRKNKGMWYRVMV